MKRDELKDKLIRWKETTYLPSNKAITSDAVLDYILNQYLSPSPVPVEELRAGKYRMTVDVYIKPCEENMKEYCPLCTRRMNVRWPGYLDTCLKWLLDGGATFEEVE